MLLPNPTLTTVGGSLSAELSENNSSTYIGPLLLRHGGDLHISGTWVGTLALQRYWEPLGSWKTEKSWTGNPTEGQAIDTLTKDAWRVTFTSYTSGTANVALKSRSTP